MRTILSIAIFLVIPLALILSQRTSDAASQLALSIARYSSILMLAGAFMIGFAQSAPVLIAGQKLLVPRLLLYQRLIATSSHC